MNEYYGKVDSKMQIKYISNVYQFSSHLKINLSRKIYLKNNNVILYKCRKNVKKNLKNNGKSSKTFEKIEFFRDFSQIIDIKT